MLAEIFMVRLEATRPVSREKLPSSNSQFVSFTPDPQLTFKQGWDRPADAEQEKPQF
jgi:hypothetical protein